MSINLAWLQGDLEYVSSEYVQIDERMVFVIHALLHTDTRANGGRHRLLFTGEPAEIMLDVVPLNLENPPVAINGCWRSYDTHSVCEVKRIFFLTVTKETMRVQREARRGLGVKRR